MISIIIPLYNKADFIARTVRSVMNLPECEVVIVDDGSTDGSAEICESVIDGHDNVLMIKGKHEGVSAARNLGLKYAKDTYVCFLDADDVYCGAYFPHVIEILSAKKPDILMFDFSSIDYVTGQIQTYTLPFQEGFVSDGIMGHFVASCFGNYAAYNVSNKIYLRQMLCDGQIVFNEQISLMEDVSFFLNSLSAAMSLYYVPLAVHQYTINVTGSLKQSKSLDYGYVPYMVGCYYDMATAKGLLDDALAFDTIVSSLKREMLRFRESSTLPEYCKCAFKSLRLIKPFHRYFTKTYLSFFTRCLLCSFDYVQLKIKRLLLVK